MPSLPHSIPCAHCGRHGDEFQFTYSRALDDWLCDECLELFVKESNEAEKEEPTNDLP